MKGWQELSRTREIRQLVGEVGKCLSCGSENVPDTERCAKCGSHLRKEVACPDCGVSNWSDSSMCRICGARLNGIPSTPRATASERPGYRPKVTTCQKCGSRYDSNLVGCPACEPGAFLESSSGRGTQAPLAAGTLLFVAGILNILTAVLFLSYLGATFVEFAYCGMVLGIMGLAALPAWVFCMQRSHFAYCIVAAVITMISIGPLFISSLLGFAAVVLIAIGAKEFR